MSIGRPKGSRGKNTERKKWMSKDGVSILPRESEWDSYLKAGWHFGNDSDHQKADKKKWYNNGLKNIQIKQGENVPEGFVPGMYNNGKGRFAKFQYKWYTNGLEQKRISIIKGDSIPEGWWPGQSEKMKEANRKAQLGKIRTPEQIENYKKGCQKSWSIKLIRGTFNTSNPEELLYKKLIQRYGEDNVKRQYKDVIRYPWHCDFYIPSEDLFIEVNNFPTHGVEPFNPNNEEHVKLLEKFKNNPTNWIEKKMVYAWADLDVRKRECARKNKLNYIMIYGDKIYYVD